MKFFNFIVEFFIFLPLGAIIFINKPFYTGVYALDLAISFSVSFFVIYFQKKNIIILGVFFAVCIWLILYLLILSVDLDLSLKFLPFLAIALIITYIVLNQKRIIYKKSCLMQAISVLLGIITFLFGAMFIAFVQGGIGETNLKLSKSYFLSSPERNLVIFNKLEKNIVARVTNIKKYAIKNNYIFGESSGFQPYSHDIEYMKTHDDLDDTYQEFDYFIINFKTKENQYFKTKASYEKALKDKKISNYKYMDRIGGINMIKFNMIYPLINANAY